MAYWNAGVTWGGLLFRAWDIVGVRTGHFGMFDQGLQLCEFLGKGYGEDGTWTTCEVLGDDYGEDGNWTNGTYLTLTGGRYSGGERNGSVAVRSRRTLLGVSQHRWPGAVLSKQTSTYMHAH